MRVLPKIVVTLLSFTVLFPVGAQAGRAKKPVLTGEIAARWAKLDQLAILVSALSNGSSRLQINNGVCSPSGTCPVRPIEGTTLKENAMPAPFMSVFSVSEPVKTKLEGIAEGKILGAVDAIVPIGAPDSKDKAEPGVYMLFFPEPICGGVTTRDRRILLVSLSVDNQGNIQYKEVAATDDDFSQYKAEASQFVPMPQVTASFVSNVPARVDVEMEWHGQKHKFTFEMEIIFI